MASANIFSQFLQAPKSVLDYQAQYEEGDARRANLEARTQQNALQSLALRQQTDQFGQAQDDRNALQRVAAGWSATTPVSERSASLRNTGRPALIKEADALESSDIKRRDGESQIRERDAKAGKDQQSLADQKKQSAITQVAALNSPQEAMQLLQSYTDSGEVPAQLAPALSRMIQTDPKWQLKLVMGISDPAKMLELLKPHLQTVNAGNAQVQQAVDPMTGAVTETGRTQIMQSPDNAATNQRVASEGALNRSQQDRISNRADTRAREQLAQGKVPSGYRANPDGSLSFIPGGPADPKMKDDKPLTEGQAKDLAFGSRMRASNQIIDQLAEKGTTTNISGMDAGMGMGRVITAMSSDKQQQLNQAKRDWINANLRRESGAVIGKDEFDSADRQYFPQIGDGDETVKQKKQNRMLAEQGVLAGTPSGRRDELVKPGGGAAPPGASALSKEEQAELAALKKRFGK